jgi:putative oxidoreductase
VIGVDIASVILRIAIGATMIAHGYNHAFGGGKLPGTARWFESIGIRPGWAHAAFATLTELGAGTLLMLGLLTPVAAGSVAGTMMVALVAAHRRNGFFIFRPGQGYEYVLNLFLASVALGALGGGRLSLDHAAGLRLDGWGGLVIAAAVGLGGAALLLVTSWRPASVQVSVAEREATRDAA